MNRFIILSLLLLVGLTAPCQSKKERRKCRLKSATEYETSEVNGKSTTSVASFEEYDKEGRIITKIDYSPSGEVKYKSTVKYDSYGNKIAETELDVAKKRNLMWTYRYNALKDKTEESEYSADGTLQKKTLFTYDVNGNRLTETESDAAGNLLRKIQYTYNNKELKSGKTTVRFSGGEKEKSKRWEYEYY